MGPRMLASRYCVPQGGMKMIDHPDTVAPLLEQMQDQLPMHFRRRRLCEPFGGEA